MKIVEPSWEVLWAASGSEMLRLIELAGRTSYKSEGVIASDSAPAFVQRLISRGHFSVLEHVSISARVICDRGVSHEIVRHRIASYTQESTRFCNYSDAKFGSEITVVRPSFLVGVGEDDPSYRIWQEAMLACETAYLKLLSEGAKPEHARSVLPNSLKTELLMTMNVREWRHFFALRTAPASHPDMRRIASGLLDDFRGHVDVLFSSFDA